jgi:hypothetical protein
MKVVVSQELLDTLFKRILHAPDAQFLGVSHHPERGAYSFYLKGVGQEVQDGVEIPEVGVNSDVFERIDDELKIIDRLNKKSDVQRLTFNPLDV